MSDDVDVYDWVDLAGYGLSGHEKHVVHEAICDPRRYPAAILVAKWLATDDDTDLLFVPRAPRIALGSVKHRTEAGLKFGSELDGESATDWVPRSQITLFVATDEPQTTNQRGLADFSSPGGTP